MRTALRALAILFIALGLASPPLAVCAQSDVGEIDLNVVDDGAKPLGNVRTFLLGAQTANALTTASGAITFTDVPVGIYRIRVQLRGYDAATTREFDVLPDRAVHVHIALAKRAGTGGGSRSTASGSDNGSSRDRASTSRRPTSTPTARSGGCPIR
jgi:hypothetical protein